MLVRRLVRARLVRAAAGLAVATGGVLVAAPALGAVTDDPEMSTTLTPPPGVTDDGTVGILATIEDAEAFCGPALGGVYVFKPTPYTVRSVNCRDTDVFVKGRYSNGSFGTCVLVPARHSRHLGGSVLKPMADAQLC
ncbi:hypothetical protein ACFO3K_09960 [Cellulomonas algicola]|uniref:Subtilisin inhibitor domain-containing protein n=1 Tax=Cellulomonas algicola TaxID=2071633 RepID=A0A401V0G0_9CELL|nr:hypothetical protein [Cellulomonas algicola]GCD20290.1 hypothetical protein CTKZ_18520 [Cellulomonas algicola]